MNYVDAMNLLSEEIKRRADAAGSLRALSIQAGVSYSGLQNLRDNPQAEPELETLAKLGRAFGLPFWRMVEMAGFNLEFSETPTVQGQRIAEIVRVRPQYRDALDRLIDTDPANLDAVIVFLEDLERRRAQSGG